MGCSWWHLDRPKRQLDWQSAARPGCIVSDVCCSASTAVAIVSWWLGLLGISSFSLILIMTDMAPLMPWRRVGSRHKVKYQREHEEGRQVKCAHGSVDKEMGHLAQGPGNSSSLPACGLEDSTRAR